MMKGAVGLAIGTDGIEVTLLSYLVPCVAADWGLTGIQEGSLTASVFAGELVSGPRTKNIAAAAVAERATKYPQDTHNSYYLVQHSTAALYCCTVCTFYFLFEENHNRGP